MNARGGGRGATMPLTHEIEAAGARLPADLDVPEEAQGIVVFAHGSGSSRLSPRNQAVADDLRSDGAFGTLLFDLLTPEEDADYSNRFDIDLLTSRLVEATEWLATRPEARSLPVGYFGASTGAAAALSAAARMRGSVRCVVSRGGRPDLGRAALPDVDAPVLLIVGGLDTTVIGLNEIALGLLGSRVKRLEIVPGATHLFEERGTLEEVMRLSREWFDRYLM